MPEEIMPLEAYFLWMLLFEKMLTYLTLDDFNNVKSSHSATKLTTAKVICLDLPWFSTALSKQPSYML